MNRALEEGSNEGNRADVEGAVMFTTQSDTLIETSTVQHGESSAGRLEAKKDKTISAAERIGLESDNDPDKKEVELREKLEYVQAQLALNPTDVMLQQDEKAVFLKLRDTQKAAYSFLKQKAKVDWMREGDENSKMFHNAIKQRLYRNKILRIQDAYGNIVTGQDNITELFVSFYQDLFSKKVQERWNEYAMEEGAS
ncbi:hypothetical protein RIF29_38430 [Crotalaria pallida]|uniref:Uncharacterized protein n=1 Tax=Crotalaria pallida TaxID=3830 RepID=A0AAN9DZQ1_CROPI